jgi:hypothetical protein
MTIFVCGIDEDFVAALNAAYAKAALSASGGGDVAPERCSVEGCTEPPEQFYFNRRWYCKKHEKTTD